MLSCKDVVKTVSSEEKLSWQRQIQVQFHLLICKHCAKYVKQIAMIKTTFKNFLKEKVKMANLEKIDKIESEVIDHLKNR